MNINLTGRKAVVTGSTAGIGRAIAEGLARAGASVVISGRGEERVAAALRELRKLFPQVEFTGVTADLATAKGAADLFARAPDADILVNNVGTGRPKPFFEIDDSEWVALFELNVMSGIRAARHYVPNMTKRGWGRVVFISSESALAIPKDMIDYANDIAEGKVYMMNTEESHASLFSRRRLIINCAIATAGLSFTGMAGAQETPVRTQLDKAPDPSITLQIYKGFSQNRLDLWDAVIHPDVKSNSPAGRNIDGIAALKRWNQAFITAFRPRTDLIDHFVAGDRGLVTINLHWKHDRPFNGLAPTGKSGTSVENFILRIENGLVTQWDVADGSLDLAIYLHDKGLKMPTFVEPPALIKGGALAS